MLTVSPPVSPSVVARILMIQKVRVTAGTLLIAVFAFTATAQLLECEKHRRVPGVAAFRRVLHARRDIAKQMVVVGQIVTNTGTDAGNRAAIVGVGRLMEYLRADLQLRCALVVSAQPAMQKSRAPPPRLRTQPPPPKVDQCPQSFPNHSGSRKDACRPPTCGEPA